MCSLGRSIPGRGTVSAEEGSAAGACPVSGNTGGQSSSREVMRVREGAEAIINTSDSVHSKQSVVLSREVIYLICVFKG